MLGTYSEATLDNCSFVANKAADTGGAVYVKISSQIRIRNSILRLNKAKNSGGSMLIHHSQAIVQSSTFSNESVTLGYGGAICVESVANVTVQETSFDGCVGLYGGAMSVMSDSILKLEYSNLTASVGLNKGGGLYVDESSEINLNIFNLLENSVSESGGAIYCRNSQVTLEKGNFIHNTAKRGGGVFGNDCRVVFDYIQIVNNIATLCGGGMYFETSIVEIHNSEGYSNTAYVGWFPPRGSFGCIMRESKLQSNYMHLPDAEWRSVVIEEGSVVDMRHTYLPNLASACTFEAESESQILLDPVYFTDFNYTRNLINYLSSYFNSGSIVCTDNTIDEQRIVKG